MTQLIANFHSLQEVDFKYVCLIQQIRELERDLREEKKENSLYKHKYAGKFRKNKKTK